MPNANRLLSLLFAPVAIIFLLGASGCAKDVVHQRSIAELNAKAQSLMQAGDYAGAIGRLEAAHDLEPDEPNTSYNLAIAYQNQGDYDKAITTFTPLLENPGGLDKAEIQKALGISYEAKADKLEADVKTQAEDPKGDKAKAQLVEQEAVRSYKMALSYYKQAVGGLKNGADVQAQIGALENKLAHQSAPATP